MKNQSGTIKTNLELDRVVMGGSGGYRRLPGGSAHFSLQTHRHCIIIYISPSPSIIINFYIIIYDGHQSKEKASEETLFTLAVASASQDCSDGFNFLAKLTTHVYTSREKLTTHVRRISRCPNIIGVQTDISDQKHG